MRFGLLLALAFLLFGALELSHGDAAPSGASVSPQHLMAGFPNAVLLSETFPVGQGRQIVVLRIYHGAAPVRCVAIYESPRGVTGIGDVACD